MNFSRSLGGIISASLPLVNKNGDGYIFSQKPTGEIEEIAKKYNRPQSFPQSFAFNIDIGLSSS
jgi:hypothetical protein